MISYLIDKDKGIIKMIRIGRNCWVSQVDPLSLIEHKGKMYTIGELCFPQGEDMMQHTYTILWEKDEKGEFVGVSQTGYCAVCGEEIK